MTGNKTKNALKIDLVFGVFHFIMPLLGWLVGHTFERYIADFDHWVAFSLLFGIGAKIVYDSLRSRNDDSDPKNIMNNVVLAGLAFATSIDALIVGISLGLLELNLFMAAGIIGFTAQVLSLS